MKRIIAVLMVTLLIFSLAACGNKEDTKETTTAATEAVTTAENNAETPGVDPLEVLETVYGSYSTADEFYFYAGGGDMLTEETTNWEGPAAFGTTGDAAEALTATLHFPAASVSKLTKAASLMHAMNANTFTCGAFQVADATEMDSIAAEIKTELDGTQWMCGFPEKVVIAKVGNIIVSFYGNTQLVDDFSAKLATAYTNTVVVIDEAIVA